jgi:DNA modification methylase
LEAFWIQVERLMKDDHTPILHFCNTRFGYDLIKSKEKWFRYDLVWNKNRGVSFLLANKMPMKSHENIYVFAKKGATYYRKDIEVEGKTGYTTNQLKVNPENIYGIENRLPRSQPDGTRCVLSVIDSYWCPLGRANHPTQKPADLYEWLIERYSKEGDTILDPTAGSFTSVFTATRMNRNAIGIEKDDAFYDKASSSLTTE